ncbi:MAG TPA: hypothetical protein VFT42_06200 [Solirubrobacteraceae bacterium]|nr:hypothetical protein [Solirubrobacteraceae bacterium]
MLRGAVLSLLASLVLAAGAGAAGDPILPLAQVHPGMQCTGYSVVHGTTPASFDVTIEDVVSGDPGSRQPRLLIKVSGPAVDATGIGPGFSGSPIYCTGDDGVARNAGAISESLGDYGNHVALATPIEAILGEPVVPPAQTRYRPALVRAARPIAEPLSVTGISAPLANALQRAARKRGRVLFDAPAAPFAGFAGPPLVPGSAVAVGLASGDVTAGAIGTVAYVDGSKVWAFGHPLDSAGRRALLLEDAYVYTVVNNPVGTEDASTYKLAAPGADVGTLSDDAINAIVGTVGALPPRYPLHIVARDTDSGARQVTNVLLADESGVGLPTGSSALSDVGPMAVAQAAYEILDGAPDRLSGSMCARFAVRELPRPLRFCNTYVGGGGGSADTAGAPLAADFAQAAELIDAYAGPRLHVTGVTVDIRLGRGLHQALLLHARGPRSVRRGHDVRIRLALRAPGSARTFARTIAVRVPRSLKAGAVELRLRGTPADQSASEDDTGTIDLGSLFGGAGSVPAARTPLDLAFGIAEIERFDGLTATFPHREAIAAYRDPQLRISGSARLRLLVRR